MMLGMFSAAIPYHDPSSGLSDGIVSLSACPRSFCRSVVGAYRAANDAWIDLFDVLIS